LPWVLLLRAPVSSVRFPEESGCHATYRSFRNHQ
jgi:hypothetical protein